MPINNWLHERDAAAKLGYKSGRSFRQIVKAGKLQITLTHVNGRSFQYLEKDIDRILLKNSTKIN